MQHKTIRFFSEMTNLRFLFTGKGTRLFIPVCCCAHKHSLRPFSSSLLSPQINGTTFQIPSVPSIVKCGTVTNHKTSGKINNSQIIRIYFVSIPVRGLRVGVHALGKRSIKISSNATSSPHNVFNTHHHEQAKISSWKDAKCPVHPD